jgi:HNH endonuclease
MDEQVCCIKGCNRKAYAHDMCATHGRRMALYGSPLRTKAIQYHGLSKQQRFFKWVEKTDGCWLWKGALSPKGYGQFMTRLNGKAKLVTASRFSWQIHHGPIPEGMHACHKCDNRRCVNPDHLFLGTHEDNMIDMVEKGRQAKAKLDAEKVKAIRLDTRKHEDIAKDYGVIRQTVTLLKARKTWRHVPGEVRQHQPEPHSGEKNPAAKLTEYDVMEIKVSNASVNALAKAYGVTHGTISAIRCGKTWARVEGPLPKRRKPRALLTEADVRAILVSPERSYVLAERYKVARSAITNIRKRRSWKHIN